MDNKQLDESKDFPLIEPEIDKKDSAIASTLNNIWAVYSLLT